MWPPELLVLLQLKNFEFQLSVSAKLLMQYSYFFLGSSTLSTGHSCQPISYLSASVYLSLLVESFRVTWVQESFAWIWTCSTPKYVSLRQLLWICHYFNSSYSSSLLFLTRTQLTTRDSRLREQRLRFLFSAASSPCLCLSIHSSFSWSPRFSENQRSASFFSPPSLSTFCPSFYQNLLRRNECLTLISRESLTSLLLAYGSSSVRSRSSPPKFLWSFEWSGFLYPFSAAFSFESYSLLVS